jgi:hypothetical protein
MAPPEEKAAVTFSMFITTKFVLLILKILAFEQMPLSLA